MRINENGEFVDKLDRRVNSKSYFVDKEGNIVNSKGQKVFSKVLLDKYGEIPNVFKANIFRKDTNDSLSKLLNEIDDFENNITS